MSLGGAPQAEYPLTLQEEPYVLGRDLKKGDALIVSSKKSVLALAAHLRTRESGAA